jgi:phage FluMu protein Com
LELPVPIRFACDRCGGVLSIARRKAYALIDCPKCGCKQVVPSESRIEAEEKILQAVAKRAERSQSMTQSLKQKLKEPNTVSVEVGIPPNKSNKETPLFERDDVENLLKQPTIPPKKIETGPTISPSNRTTDNSSTAELAAGVELIAEGGQISIRKSQLIMAIAAVIVALIFAFAIGFIFGRFSKVA